MLLPLEGVGQSDTKYLLSVTPHVDYVGINWYSDRYDRRALGLGFTSPVVDASLYLFVLQDSSARVNLWNFVIPFSAELWMCLAFSLVFAGLMLWYLRHKEHDDKSTLPLRYNMFLTLDAFAGNRLYNMHGYLPHSIIGIGFNFLVLVFNASYTANLATTLIASSTPIASLTSIGRKNRWFTFSDMSLLIVMFRIYIPTRPSKYTASKNMRTIGHFWRGYT